MALTKRSKGLPSATLGKQSPTSFRFSKEAKELLYQLSHFEGLSQTSYIEQLLRQRAREVGLLPATIGKFK